MTSTTHQIRPFFAKIGLQIGALASAYIETNSENSSESTKVACAFFGPMQLNANAAGASADSCQIKVNIEFADENKTALLQ